MITMAKKKTFTVDSLPGLNVRKMPNITAPVLKILKHGEKVIVSEQLENGWMKIDGGYVSGRWLR